jgi:hypothetical protein
MSKKFRSFKIFYIYAIHCILYGSVSQTLLCRRKENKYKAIANTHTSIEASSPNFSVHKRKPRRKAEEEYEKFVIYKQKAKNTNCQV